MRVCVSEAGCGFASGVVSSSSALQVDAHLPVARAPGSCPLVWNLSMAGYSGTPLVTKLGVKAGYSVLVLGAPAGFADTLDWPPEVRVVSRRGKGPYDVILYFTKSRAALTKDLAKLRNCMAPACGLWICWPKKASKVATDMTEDVVREVALPTGLVDNKVCAVDETWSGLRLVIRKELR